MKYLVLGGGAQGSACALELVRRSDVDHVVVADLDVSRPASFLEPYLGGRLSFRSVDASDAASVRASMEGVDAVACALPYYFNLDVSRLAIEARAHFCDLGGNTEIVDQQRELDGAAKESGVSLVPDCGLAPGMVNILAQGGIDALDEVDEVRIFVGGLPRHPEGPLGYQIVYSMEGVLDYYTTPVLVLEGGRVVEKEALSEVELVEFPEPVGTLEAFLTAGGISRMPYRYEGVIPAMTYKTLRYPGHAALMRSIRELGLIDLDPVEVDGVSVSPRDVFIATVSPKLRKPDAPDLVAMRVRVTGRSGGQAKTVGYDLIDFRDEDTGVTAMMRTTGYSLAVTARMQAAGVVAPGVHTPAECVPVEQYVADLAVAGVQITGT